MPVDHATRKILLRWQALSHPEGLRSTKLLAVWLRVLGAVLVGFVVFAVSMKFSPVWVVVGAFLVGWVSGEANALRMRLHQWDTFSRYLDWARIERDVKDAT